MKDFMTNSVQSFANEFGLDWCRKHLQQALESLYGEGRADILLLMTMLDNGTVDEMKTINLRDSGWMADWTSEKLRTSEESEELTVWALHTWMTAVRGESVFNEPVSPIAPPVIENPGAGQDHSERSEVNDSPAAESGELERTDEVSLMEQPEQGGQSITATEDQAAEKPRKRRRLLFPGIGISLTAALLVIIFLLPGTPFSESSIESGMVQGSLTDADWMEWLSHVENGTYGNDLVLPECDIVEKGKLLDTEQQNKELNLGEGCSRYTDSGMVYAAGRSTDEWNPALEEIEQNIGSPDLLNVDANAEEIRALYQRSPHDIFLIFSNIDEQDALSYIEVGDIQISEDEPAALLDYPR
ncbi:hypothetical protein [Salibacterium qingdaonense]|uniref:Uncharacterized protein n=1 Tax=Salibacterium qingdaonense TaxID=266892 RepID=A0A1I4NDM9_9BACI|nr:hypothetical protein [Salibacterium qingdaonense]SFM13390.1 hypothetical protein SAMN04488054_1171 [Salibacterium qingdaonense]